MSGNTQIMAKTSQYYGSRNGLRILHGEWLVLCYPQVCTQIENRYLIKI